MSIKCLKCFAVIIATVSLLSSASFAGIRSAGPYSGVVIFDRWDGCTLYSGVWLMYISESVKEQLRTESGKCVQINATKVHQPINPGDGLISEFALLGPAPTDERSPSVAGLKLSATPIFEDGNIPQFIIHLQNTSEKIVTISMDSLAPTILKNQANHRSAFSPSDSPSVAAVTRQAFWVDGPRIQSGATNQSVFARWWVTEPRNFPRRIALQPQEKFEIHLSFKLPEGEYEFIAGYGGSMNAVQCIASNLIAFDTDINGTAKLVHVPGR